MSNEINVPLTCPHCGKDIELPAYTSINRQENPELAEKVIDGSLFMPECPECGVAIPSFYPLVYNDMEHMLMAHLVAGEDDTAIAVDAINDCRAAAEDMGEIGEAMKQEHWRVVTDPFALQEKATVFDAGLDDRPVEFLKAVIYVEYADQLTAPESRVLFSGVNENDELTFEAFNGESVAIVNVPRELYDNMLALPAASSTPEDYQVNEAWAMDALAQ